MYSQKKAELAVKYNRKGLIGKINASVVHDMILLHLNKQQFDHAIALYYT
jgi:hypothetical protein